MTAVFSPQAMGTIAIANATAATSPVALSDSADVVALYNSSSTATAFVELSGLPTAGTAGRSAVVPSDSVRGSFPVPPGQMIRVRAGYGYKTVSVIASAADGVTYICPGTGS